MTARLTLHRGAYLVAREDVTRVTTPDHTATWMPIRHDALLDGVQGALERAGLRVASEQHALAREGNRMFSLLRLTDGTDARDFALTLYEGLLGLQKVDEQRSAHRPTAPLPMHVAMQEARVAIAERPRGLQTWGAYQHYGTPYLRLFDPATMGVGSRQ